MIGQALPLGAEEQHTSNEVTKLLSAVAQEIQQLTSLDVSTSRAVQHGYESKTQEKFRHIRRLISDLKVAAEEQDT